MAGQRVDAGDFRGSIGGDCEVIGELVFCFFAFLFASF